MVRQDFINREKELEHLNKEYAKERPSFVVIYGRRRVGKTRLIEEFIKDKKAVYYLAAQETEQQQINELKDLISKRLNDNLLASLHFTIWKELFEYLKKIWPKDEKIVLVIDEVTFVIKSNSSFTSYLQNFWDTFLQETKTFLILNGSIVSLMIKEVLSQESPLYGRRTSQINLMPFDFEDSCKFLKGDFEQKVKSYALVGGVAKYLLLSENSFEELLDAFLNKEGFFYQEGLFVITQEFKDPSTYADILKAVSFGNTKLNDISTFTGINTKILSRYIDILINIGFITRKIPPTEDPKKYRGAIYLLNDNFLTFWNRFIQPNKSYLEIRHIKEVYKLINKDINGYIGFKFEQICEEYLLKNYDYAKIGNWWGHKRVDNKREEIEIDIVALNDGTSKILFCEVKWQDNVDAKSILSHLKEKAESVEWRNTSREGNYVIFAKSFKTKQVEGAELYDLDDLEKFFLKS